VSSELSRRALERAEAMRSPRAAEVLRRAVVVVGERAGEAWESSEGSVRAVFATLLLDGTSCGLIATFPSVRDAVVEAVSAAAPEVLEASVVDIRFAWALKEHGEAGYRDGPAERADRGSPDDVRRALAAFLAASGDEATARAVERARVRVHQHGVDVDGVDRARIDAALAALLRP
jgi:hypothetical protein